MLKLGQESGELLMEPEEERRMGKERRVCRRKKKKKGFRERGRERLEDKERQTERGGGGRWEMSRSPEGSLLVSHSTGPSNV